jgi:hypothetical protein
MRALWLIPAVFALFSAAANAGSGTVDVRRPTFERLLAAASPSGNGSRGGNARGQQVVVHHRYQGPRYGYGLPYASPYYAQPGDADPGYVDSGNDGSVGGQGYAQVQYEQPQDDVPAAAAVPTIQAAVSYAVQYFTSGQQPPANIPVNARVTKGTLYKYAQNGVNTYTDMPPPGDVGAKALFSYTEIDTPLAR